jgi:hypothetical protein
VKKCRQPLPGRDVACDNPSNFSIERSKRGGVIAVLAARLFNDWEIH